MEQTTNKRNTITVPSHKSDDSAPRVVITATLTEPTQISFIEVPTPLRVQAYYDTPERTPLLDLSPIMVYSGLMYEPAWIMDSISADLGVVGTLLFDQCEAPRGNILLINPYKEPAPSEKIFHPNFNLEGLINGIIHVCNELLQHPLRKARYFAYLGCPSPRWPMDIKWRAHFHDRSEYMTLKTYEPGTFLAIKATNDPQRHKHYIGHNGRKFYQLSTKEMLDTNMTRVIAPKMTYKDQFKVRELITAMVHRHKSWYAVQKKEIEKQEKNTWRTMQKDCLEDMQYPYNLLFGKLFSYADARAFHKEYDIDRTDRLLGLLWAIHSLPEENRLAIEYIYREQMSKKEAGERMNRKVPEFTQLLNAGYKQLTTNNALTDAWKKGYITTHSSKAATAGFDPVAARKSIPPYEPHWLWEEDDDEDEENDADGCWSDVNG